MDIRAILNKLEEIEVGKRKHIQLMAQKGKELRKRFQIPLNERQFFKERDKFCKMISISQIITNNASEVLHGHNSIEGKVRGKVKIAEIHLSGRKREERKNKVG